MRRMCFILILVGVMAGSNAKAQDPRANKSPTQPAAASITTPAISQEQVVAKIKKCGDTVKRDGNAPDGAVVEVIFDRKSSQGVTEAGLEHLEGLSQLRSLSVYGSRVTSDGVKKHQEALPNCEIVR